MNFLIDLYDNFLIYDPNIFFPLLFLLSILGIILLVKLTVFLSKESKGIVKEIKISLRKIKLKKRWRIKIPKSKLRINIFNLIKFVNDFVTEVNNILGHSRFKVEKIIMKIKKEIFID